jgi:hypothetical protein
MSNRKVSISAWTPGCILFNESWWVGAQVRAQVASRLVSRWQARVAAGRAAAARRHAGSACWLTWWSATRRLRRKRRTGSRRGGGDVAAARTPSTRQRKRPRESGRYQFRNSRKEFSCSSRDLGDRDFSRERMIYRSCASDTVLPLNTVLTWTVC